MISKAHGDITRHRGKTINVKGFGNDAIGTADNVLCVINCRVTR